MFRKPCFRGNFDRQHDKWIEILLQSERQHLYHIYQSLWRQIRQEKSLLVIHKILRMFVNTLTAHDKHYLLDRDNLTQPIQMQLSQKQNIFLNFSLHFGNLYQILNTFQEKTALIADVFPDFPALKNMIRYIPENQCFRRPFDRQHRKWIETLLQSERQHLYNIY